jgi:RNA polymerase sigma-70 factor (ECF subfamily)
MSDPDSNRDPENRLVEWFRRWRTPLRRFLASRSAVRPADYDDVAQEVFLRLLRYDAARIVEHPQAYLFKMAANVAAEWSIRASNRQVHEPHWLASLVAEDRPDDALDCEAAQREIKRALNTLSPRERAILKLYFEEGLGQAEIAHRLGVSFRVVRRDFEKSYAKLRRELNDELTRVLQYGRE